MMNLVKRQNLDSKGWKVGTPTEFLGLTPAEETFIEMKIILSQNLKETRKKKRLSQVEFAKLIQSSQSRVAKMENGSATVSIDLLIKSLLALGVTKMDLAKTISSKQTIS